MSRCKAGNGKVAVELSVDAGMPLRFATVNHRLVTIVRGDDCRCIVTIKKDGEGMETVGVGSGLRELAGRDSHLTILMNRDNWATFLILGDVVLLLWSDGLLLHITVLQKYLVVFSAMSVV
jgi:hypothetical protein